MKPLRTATRSGYLASIFSLGQAEKLHGMLASLCVLFEDLRIEISGISADELDQLDECGEKLRRIYFLRRSIATLHEFGVVLQELDKLASFEPLRRKFSETALKSWKRAIAYFATYERYIKRLRHNVGGHFQVEAGEMAMRHLLRDAVGCLEIADYNRGGGAKLFFATELAATALLGNVSHGGTSMVKSEKLLRYAVVGYRRSAWAVDCVIQHYLWDRFGK